MPSKTRNKTRISKQRDVRVHAELWHTANCLLEAGLLNQKGSTHQFRSSLVFRAFTLEAYLNWHGQILISHWKYLERLGPTDKLELLADLSGISRDYGARPWRIVKNLFGFRNDIAHGKPADLSSVTLVKLDRLDEHLGERIRTRWEMFCTEQNAVKAKEDVEKIINMLYEGANMRSMSKGPYTPFGFGFHLHRAKIGPE